MSKLKSLVTEALESKSTLESLEYKEAMEGLSLFSARCVLVDAIASELAEQATGSAQQVLTVDQSKLFNELVNHVYDRLSSKYAL